MTATPAYADEYVALYEGDCLEDTRWTQADVLITDPPYGRGWKQGRLAWSHWADDSHAGIQGDETTEARDRVLALWGDKPAMVFGDLMLPPPPGTKQVLVYRKPTNAGIRGAMAGFRRDLEAIYLVGKWPSGLGGKTSLIGTGARAQGSPGGLTGRYSHPHAKPVDVMQELLSHVDADAFIADPFSGSGSTLVAAKQLGRSAVGFEIEPEYVLAASRRLGQDVLFGETL